MFAAVSRGAALKKRLGVAQEWFVFLIRPDRVIRFPGKRGGTLSLLELTLTIRRRITWILIDGISTGL